MADGSVTIDTKLNNDGFEKGLSGIQSKLNKFSGIANTAFNGVKTAVAGTAKAIGIVSTAIGGVAVAGAKYNAGIEQYQTSFEVMTGSAEKATETVENLKKLGAETPFEMTDLAETTQLLMNYGLNADDAQSKLKMLGDISQGSADKMNRIAMAYGQMSSAGKVSLEDVKQMIEAGFNPLQEISQSTGESMSSLYDRISKGTISVDEITASMERSTSAGGKYFQSMQKQSQTVSGQISTLKDNVSQLMGGLAKGFSQSLGGTILPLLNETASGLQEAFNTGGIEGFTKAIGPVLANLITKMSEQLPNIINLGVNIIQSLISGIQQNLHQILQGATLIINSLNTRNCYYITAIATSCITSLTNIDYGIFRKFATFNKHGSAITFSINHWNITNATKLNSCGIGLHFDISTGVHRQYRIDYRCRNRIITRISIRFS